MKIKSASLVAAPLLAAALAASAPAQAQGTTTSGWQFETALYGWFPAISGTTSFPPHNGGPSIDLSSGDVLDALKMAFFTAVQVRNREWGLFTDIAYADLGGSKSGSTDITIDGIPRPVGVTANLDLDIKTWIWTLAGTYQLKNDAAASVDVLFGARMLDVTNRLRYDISKTIGGLPPQTNSGTTEASTTNWDGVVGIKGRFFLGADRRWFLPFYADIGAGESKLTWQVNGGVGYQFDWGAVVGSWRYLDYDFKSGSHIQSQTMSGPLIGLVLRF